MTSSDPNVPGRGDRPDRRRRPRLPGQPGRPGRAAVLALLGTVVVTLAATAGAGPAVAQVHPGPVVDSADLPATISADPLLTPQVDGIVFSVAIVGNTVYAAGRFTKARPSGTSPGDPAEVTRTNLLAFDLTTGALLPFNHTITSVPFVASSDPGPFCRATGAPRTWVCDTVYRVKASPDGSRIYIVGDFTAVDGVTRTRVAAFDTATGALVPNFAPVVSSRVRGLSIGATAVYLGGSFTTVDGVLRDRIAAVDLNGRVIRTFGPSANGDVWAVTLTTPQNRLLVGGQFTILSGAAKVGLGAVTTTTGASAPWSSQPVQRHPANTGTGFVTDIAVSGTTAYVTGADFVAYPAFEGRMAADAATGNQIWLDQCHGDTQAVAVAAGVVYSVSHDHDCSMMNGWPNIPGNQYQRFVAETAAATTVNGLGQPIPALLTTFPSFDYGPLTSYWRNGTWAVAADGTNVVVGGEFLTVNGQPQQGLTRFVVRSASPHLSGPVGLTTPDVATVRAGTATVTWTATWDRDDPTLTYTVVRDDIPVATLTADSRFWALPTLSWVDPAAGDGTPHTYRIRAADPDGNTVTSPDSASITVAPATSDGTALGSDYPGAVARDGAVHDWHLGEAAPATQAADSGTSPAELTLGPTVTLGTAGIIGRDGGTAVSFDGTDRGRASTTVAEPGPQTFSVEAWVSSRSRHGGLVVGFGNAATGTSTLYDRHIWLSPNGQLNAGIYDARVQTITTTATYNDGGWHHVVLTEGSSGMAFYVDGVLIGALPTVTARLSYAGYWRLGGDNLTGWSTPWPAIGAGWATSNDLAADVAEVAVYPAALTPAQVSDHFLRGISG